MVCLQMTTSLRPLVGKADTFLPKQKKFFLTHWSESMGLPKTTQSERQAAR
jgi:hypothetical protein